MAIEARDAARRWAETWTTAWPSGDAAAIAALYAQPHIYRSHPHREPEVGGALAYTSRTFAEESQVRCRFGDPIVDADRAVVEWWAAFDEGNGTITLSGATVLRFDADGLVREHLDYWVEAEGSVRPFEGWAAERTV